MLLLSENCSNTKNYVGKWTTSEWETLKWYNTQLWVKTIQFLIWRQIIQWSKCVLLLVVHFVLYACVFLAWWICRNMEFTQPRASPGKLHQYNHKPTFLQCFPPFSQSLGIHIYFPFSHYNIQQTGKGFIEWLALCTVSKSFKSQFGFPRTYAISH